MFYTHKNKKAILRILQTIATIVAILALFALMITKDITYIVHIGFIFGMAFLVLPRIFSDKFDNIQNPFRKPKPDE